MTEKNKNNKILFPVLIFVFGIIAVAMYVNKSGRIVNSENNTFSQWIGKEAPDFTVTDINGNKHSISDYRGKNLVVVFWATWCPPCRAEIPHLIELRNQESEEKLAMIAISTSEDADTVKNFAKQQSLNYTVAALGNSYLPSPFANIEFIPTTFFIDPDGKIKTVVVQSLTLKQINAIINAKTTG